MGNSCKKKFILADCKRDHYAICLYNLNGVKYCNFLFGGRRNKEDVHFSHVFFTHKKLTGRAQKYPEVKEGCDWKDLRSCL